MKKKKIQLTLFFSGLLLFVVSGIVSQYVSPPDFVSGLIYGAAIGLLLVSLLRKRAH